MLTSHLQIRVLLLIFVADLDFFEAVSWVAVPAVNRDAAIADGADRLTKMVVALFHKAASYATPDISGLKVEIQADCITYTADYTNIITPAEANFTGWSPDLHDLVAEKSREVKSDMVDLLTSLAVAHFDGTTSEGGVRYVIRTRG